MRSPKTHLKRIINRAGFDLHRLHPGLNPAFQLFQTLNQFDVDLVLDVGANAGQFTAELRSVGFDGTVVSFEPLSTAHAILTEAARGDSQWLVHSRCAIGDRAGTVEINVSGNSVSSSLLPMMDAHSAAAPDSAYVGSERVTMDTLDHAASQYLARSSAPFLKIDTQGFEWQVLDGARHTLSRLRGLICEVSLVPLYTEQHLWRDVIDRVVSEGFTLWSVQKGFVDPRNGRSLQLDVAFVRM